MTEEPPRPATVPENAQWLGGIGEGRWFALNESGGDFQISRFDLEGSIEYTVEGIPDKDFDVKEPYSFTFSIHHREHCVVQKKQIIVFSSQFTILQKSATNY